MRRIRPSSEAEMIAEFLKAELDSPRFGSRYLDRLDQMGRDRSLVDAADLGSDADNEARRALLGAVRGFGVNRSFFAGFPADVGWELVELSIDELRRARYARVFAWMVLSQGSGLVGDAAANVDPDRVERLCALPELSAHAGTRLRIVAEAIRTVAKEHATGRGHPNLIAVQHGPDILLIEGYTRATAFVSSGSNLPVRVILGRSSGFDSWMPTKQLVS